MEGTEQDDRATRTARRAETREEIVARVTREQHELHPAPVYSARSLRRLRAYLVAIFPLGLLLGWLSGLAFGWDVAEWIGAAVGLWLALAYIGYVVITERDDGRVHDEVRRILEEREQAGD